MVKKSYYLGEVPHFQVETDNEDVPGHPQHEPDCILPQGGKTVSNRIKISGSHQNQR